MRDDFAIFIMSYKRPNNIATLRTLNKANYTGKYYIIVGDDDPLGNVGCNGVVLH